MRYVITAANGHHLRSESVANAAEGVEAAERLRGDGFAIILILDSLYRQLSLTELRTRADGEPSTAYF